MYSTPEFTAEMSSTPTTPAARAAPTAAPAAPTRLGRATTEHVGLPRKNWETLFNADKTLCRTSATGGDLNRAESPPPGAGR